MYKYEISEGEHLEGMRIITHPVKVGVAVAGVE